MHVICFYSIRWTQTQVYKASELNIFTISWCPIANYYYTGPVLTSAHITVAHTHAAHVCDLISFCYPTLFAFIKFFFRDAYTQTHVLHVCETHMHIYRNRTQSFVFFILVCSSRNGMHSVILLCLWQFIYNTASVVICVITIDDVCGKWERNKSNVWHMHNRLSWDRFVIRVACKMYIILPCNVIATICYQLKVECNIWFNAIFLCRTNDGSHRYYLIFRHTYR